MTHTPGPWSDGQPANFRVYGPPNHGRESGPIAIALGISNLETQRANAKLIASAPSLKALNAELLAALIQMESWASTFAKQLHTVDAKKIPLHRNIGKARAVIAKAKELE